MHRVTPNARVHISWAERTGRVTHLLWLLTGASIVGTVANVHRRRWGFGVWLVTNAGWVAHNLCAGDWPQAGLWTVYFALAGWGWVRWDNGDEEGD